MMLLEQTQALWEQDELPLEFKWIEKLSPRNQRIFFADVQYQWGRYCATKNSMGLTEFFEDWMATAEVDAETAQSAFLLAEKSEDDYEEWAAAS